MIVIVNLSTFTQFIYIYLYHCIAPQPVVAQIMGFCPSNIIVIEQQHKRGRKKNWTIMELFYRKNEFPF